MKKHIGLLFVLTLFTMPMPTYSLVLDNVPSNIPTQLSEFCNGCFIHSTFVIHDINFNDSLHYASYKCNKCGYEFGLKNSGLHTFNPLFATCTEDSACACGYVREYAKGHDYSGADATCTTAKVCKRCDAVLEEALGHDYSGADATCTSDNVCARPGCGA